MIGRLIHHLMNLEISEHTITFGPFETDYFRAHAAPEKREWFFDQIRTVIIPQLTGPVLAVKGRVYSDYDKLRHLGPVSIVKFHFSFNLEFTSKRQIEKVYGRWDFEDINKPVVYVGSIDNAKTRNEARELKEREIAALSASADPDITIGDSRFNPVVYEDIAGTGAKTLEGGTVFGPFHTDHFRQAVDEKFRADFFTYARTHLLPRIKGQQPVIEGQVYAPYDEERHLGPNSALKNRYRIMFTFTSPQGKESVSGLLIYERATGEFSPGRGKLYWMDFEKNREADYRGQIVDRIAYRYAQGQRSILCPVCSSALLTFDCTEGDKWGSCYCRGYQGTTGCALNTSIALEQAS